MPELPDMNELLNMYKKAIEENKSEIAGVAEGAMEHLAVAEAALLRLEVAEGVLAAHFSR